MLDQFSKMDFTTMNNKLTEIFNQLCEENSDIFESWEITETRDGYYMQIEPVGSAKVCCGCKKKSAYEDRLNIESIINYAKRYAKRK